MKRKSRGQRGDLALKIDISKAYDRVDWFYLEAVLRRLGFCEKWIRWMMLCVCTVKYKILVNQDLIGPIFPSRGLRQGDPLSPYLFILCAEGLSALLNAESRRGAIHGLKVSRLSPAVSHLMFADDCLLFCRATEAECTKLKEVLEIYGEASGQAINLNKSGIMFSTNIDLTTRAYLSEIMGVTQALNTSKYLGLPSLIGRNKKAIFDFLRDKLWRKLNSWKGKHISKAGKEVLIKAAAQAVPAYCMSCFLLPQCLTDELERMMNSFWWGNKSDQHRGINWMAWNRLCVKKELGGMGFRSLQLFNIAMLGKIGWRLIADPDALVSRILKAKYFPRGDFLTANLGHNPSFTWRSICSSQELVRRGVRWRIEHGNKVNVWNDPWLRRDDGFYMSAIPEQSLLNLKVADLIVPGSRLWNVELLSELFDVREVKEIVSIPLSPIPTEDRLIWHYSRNGIYSVRSAYFLACSYTIDGSYGLHGNWKLLWKIKVPPKVKIFLWRALHYCLPTYSNLIGRGVQVGGICRTCNAYFENEWHTFINCPFAEECWHALGAHDRIYALAANCNSFRNFVFEIIALPDEDLSGQVTMLMWQMWNLRNSVLWNQVTPNPNSVRIQSHISRHEWIAAQIACTPLRDSNRNIVVCRAWHNMAAGWFRCEVDAAFFPDMNATGVGIIVRIANGNFLAARVVCFPGCMRVEEGEAMGMHEALSWIKELGLLQVEFLTDSKMVVDATSSIMTNCSEFGRIIENCKAILSTNNFFHVKHVRRDANYIAHCLARASRNFPSPFVWDEPPAFVEGLPSYPCSCA